MDIQITQMKRGGLKVLGKPVRKGFGLIELLVSIAIIAAISTFSYLSFTVVNRATVSIRNKTVAIDLLQKSLEEIRAFAKTDFDNIESIDLEDMSGDFDGFTRLVSITNSENSDEIKKIDITITWNDNGVEKNYDFSIPISRPSEGLPGSAHGIVSSRATSVPVANAEVKMRYVSDSGIYLVTTTNPSGYFTFSFNLKPGLWSLSCSHQSHKNYVHSSQISIGGKEDAEVNIELEPHPSPAHIKVNAVNKTSGSIVSIPVSLFKNGRIYEDYRNRYGYTPASFEVSFSEGDPLTKCFTIATSYPSKNGGFPYERFNLCGDFCGPSGWGKQYNYRGWSSSVVGEDGSVVCYNSWFGSSITDRICVSPGENRVVNIELVDIPQATLNISLPSANNNVHLHWYDSTDSSRTLFDSPTPSSSSYAVRVPAAQELFPDEQNYYLRLEGWVIGDIVDYCNVSHSSVEVPISKRIGPLYGGKVFTETVSLGMNNDPPRGSAVGRVVDGKTGMPLAGVVVTISGSQNSRITDASGNWSYTCDDASCHPIEVGSQQLAVSLEGYHTFFARNGDTISMIYGDKPTIVISENEITNYPLIRLYPKSKGAIRGRIVDAGSGTPLPGVRFNHSIPGIGSTQVITDDNGEFQLTDMLESWPPPNVKGDSYYHQASRGHWFIVFDTEEYEEKIEENVELLAGEIKDIEIPVSQKGQM
jgi:prepilin-type N-terminal cleavage/methylation domain-containing protein